MNRRKRVVRELASHGQFQVQAFASGVRKFLWLLVAIPFMACGQTKTKEPEVATSPPIVLTIEGTVEVSSSARSVWMPARTNQVLQAGDSLRTSPRSRATVRLADLTVLRVNELSTIEILPTAPADARRLIDVKAGSAYLFNRSRPMNQQFRTPLAVGAIRGTEFHVEVGPEGRTEVTLLDGEVALGNQQGEVILRNGDQGIVEPGAAPRKTAVLEANNIIQWNLYYPAILDPDELELDPEAEKELTTSLTAYRAGDLLAAIGGWPEGRNTGSNAERLYYAALLLAVGQVSQAETQLNGLTSKSPLGTALQTLIATVKHQADTGTNAARSATAWLAESYRLQSRSQLNEALLAARAAVKQSPHFGFAWERVAELEFSHGRISRAREALTESLRRSPRNAQAVALQGFLLAADNQNESAIAAFDQAISLDGSLGNAWLGRGLCRIRLGNWPISSLAGTGKEAGRQDLQVAAALEPNRADLRSYLGKAWVEIHDPARAHKELRLAKELDPNDPTAWLYSALLDQQENRVNEAIHDLERARELNDHRGVYRSRLLLDQDQSVRSANLASVYRDGGLDDVAVREASRAVNSDYVNYSGHLFLAESYDALRDPHLINLRYEAPFYSELITAQLLAPYGGGSLSPSISQQEYSRFFSGDHLGFFSSSDYLSRGAWTETASQSGVAGGFSYSLDTSYLSDPGQRSNNDIERLTATATMKQQLTAADSILFQTGYGATDSGDVAQYYNNQGSTTLRAHERQEPNLTLGYHREWSPGVDTLLLATRQDDTLWLADPAAEVLAFRTNATGSVISSKPRSESLDYHSDSISYSVELQQIWQQDPHTIIAGARYQTAAADTAVNLQQTGPTPNRPLPFTDAQQSVATDQQRVQIYGYYHWKPWERLRLIGGVSYDRLDYPANIDTAPVTNLESSRNRLSPKAGFILSLPLETYVRGSFTRSLGGAFGEGSLRLEPTEVAGFNQAFRSLIPESVIGQVPGTAFETYNLGLDHRTPFGLYLALEAALLRSDADREVGSFLYSGSGLPTTPTYPSVTTEQLTFQEKTLVATLNQLVSRDGALGIRYQASRADLNLQNINLPVTVPGAARNESAILQQLNLFANYHHPSGVFAAANALWSHQSNQGYNPGLPGEDFWQFNAYLGYRFPRRLAEIRLGLLNITGQDYQLNPLNLYNELPRSRTLAVRMKFEF